MYASEHVELVDFIAATISEFERRGLPQEGQTERLIGRVLKRFGPDLPMQSFTGALEEAMRRFEDDHLERQAILQRNINFARDAKALFRRFPAPNFGEAVELGAANGDEFAVWVQAHPELLTRTVHIR